MMDNCALPIGVSALACAVAEGLNDEELGLAAALFTVLGDQLALLAVQRTMHPGGKIMRSTE